jgi:hypothetical protein
MGWYMTTQKICDGCKEVIHTLNDLNIQLQLPFTDVPSYSFLDEPKLVTYDFCCIKCLINWIHKHRKVGT